MASSPQSTDQWGNRQFLYDPGVWKIVDESIKSDLAFLEASMDTVSNGVCDICQKVFDKWSTVLRDCDYSSEWIELEFDSHPSLLSCKAASNKGCKICSILLRGRNDIDDRDEDMEAIELVRTLEIVHHPMKLKFIWSQVMGGEYWELGFSNSQLV